RVSDSVGCDRCCERDRVDGLSPRALPGSRLCFLFFLFHDAATTQIYTLSLHDALPISPRSRWEHRCEFAPKLRLRKDESLPRERSEEHTSELQSQSNLVCRLLLEKKNSRLSLSCPARCATCPRPRSPILTACVTT